MASSESDGAAGSGTQARGPIVSATKTDVGLVVAQVYLESVTFSHRSDALSLSPGTKAEIGNIQIQLALAMTPDETSGYVRIEVRTDPAQNPVYNVDLAMMGLIGMAAREQESPHRLALREFLASPASIGFLYPFVREAFAHITGRGRFGPVWLNIIAPQAFTAEFKRVQDSLAAAVAAGAAPIEQPSEEEQPEKG